MMTLDVRAGRLAEVVFRTPMTQEELTPFMNAMRTSVERAPQPLVIVSDLRGLVRFPDAMIDPIVWIMRRDNPKIQCNAVLVTKKHAVLEKQAEEILKQAGHHHRRLFKTVEDLRGYVDGWLDAAEKKRLTAFLGA